MHELIEGAEVVAVRKDEASHLMKGRAQPATESDKAFNINLGIEGYEWAWEGKLAYEITDTSVRTAQEERGKGAHWSREAFDLKNGSGFYEPQIGKKPQKKAFQCEAKGSPKGWSS